MTSTKTTGAALRGLGVCCAIGNTVLHGLLTPSHLEEKFYIGVLFAVGSAVMLAVAAGLATMRRPTAVWLAGTLVCLGMITGFLLSRTTGLPGGYYETDWEPPYGLLSLIVEGLFLLTFLTWLARREGPQRIFRPPRAAGREWILARRSTSGQG
ncbi:hypothetical protein [Streptomyces sp. S186]|uniref:hypothetical protein n=1 Tax=Streptomyces sp. S186 TaxID=3434395 RepID=UPI003F671D3B